MAAALWFSFNAAEQVTVALVAVLVILVGIMGYRAWLKSRVTPDERERQRRTALVAAGKMGDATLIEVREDLIIYAYVVRGVEYTASQDVFPLKDQIPSDLSQLAAMSVRYDPRNPANSIVVAEQWSGLHLNEPRRRR